MIKILKILFILSLIISLALFLAHTNLTLVARSLMSVGWNFIWLIAITALAYLLGTIAWACCLGRDSRSISMIHLFWIRLIGETVSLFNPSSVVGGDYLKSVLLESFQIQKPIAARSVIVSRLTMILSQLGMAFLAFFLMADRFPNLLYPQISDLLKAGAWMLLILLVLVLGIGRYLYKKDIARKNPWFNKFFQSVREMLRITRQFYREEKRWLLLSFILFSLHWLAGSLEFYLILSFLGIHTGILEGLLVDMGVIFFKSAGAFVPGQIGMEEYGNQLMLLAIGVSGNIWITASVLRRARQLIWLGLGLFSFIFFYKKSFNQLPG